MLNKKGAERRRHIRHELKDLFFITFRPHRDRIGWITDISKGGVALEYSDIDDYAPLTEKVVVDIFSTPNRLKLSNLPCQLVYDRRVEKGKAFIESIETRRCGLVFDNMSKEHASMIDLVLKQCAVGGIATNIALHPPDPVNNQINTSAG